MSSFALHPDAFADIDEIREHIANDSPDAADRVIDEFSMSSGFWHSSPT